ITLRALVCQRFSDLLEAPARAHPRGFYFSSQPLGYHKEFRYHFWPSPQGDSSGLDDGEIHDHRFDLGSFVLAGQISNEIYTFEPQDDGPVEVVEVRYPTGDAVGWSYLSRTGISGRYCVVSSQQYGAGDVYRVPAGTIHRASA